MALDAQGPFNYNTNFDSQPVNPMASYAGGIGAGQNAVEGQLKLQGDAQSILTQQQMQRDAAAVGANPTPQALAGLAVKYPMLADKFKTVSDMMTTQQRDASLAQSIPIYAAVQSGNIETAAKLMDQNATAAQNAGDAQKAATYKMYSTMIREHPDQAKKLLAFPLIGAMGADKFAETFKTFGEETRANENQPAIVAKNTAEAASAGAKAAAEPQTVALANAKTAQEVAKSKADVALERDKLKTDTQLKMQEYNLKFGTPEGANYTTVNDAVKSSVQANADATRFQTFADQYEKVGTKSGLDGWISLGFDRLPATWQEGLKWATGNQDSITDIRNQYDIMRTKGLVANLPPQVTRLTDSDLKVFNAGIPPLNAAPARAAAFLRSMALVKHVESATEDAKGQWAAANRSLANASKEISINGVTAAPGTSFKKFLDDYLVQDVRSYKQSLVDTSVKGAGYMRFADPQAAPPAQPQPQPQPTPAQTEEARARDMLRMGQGY